jgi:hypothetical protein
VNGIIGFKMKRETKNKYAIKLANTLAMMADLVANDGDDPEFMNEFNMLYRMALEYGFRLSNHYFELSELQSMASIS